ncbi:hypothetical protein D5085_16450 [Ectothiorhodospiraceae bacterium BW-2]|nr:hypothetical protein D5085_16450 [Ectothiorhodospiraceae bacterium BW-2]
MRLIRAIDKLALENRRRHFRVDSVLSVGWREVTAAEIDAIRTDYLAVREFSGEQLQQEQAILQGLHRVEQHYPDLGELLMRLNSKIDALRGEVEAMRQRHQRHNDIANRGHHSVNLSASGMALLLQQPLERDSQLLLQLELPAIGLPLQVVAKVIYSLWQPEESLWRTGMEFEYLFDDDQQLIQHHVMQVQQQQLAQRAQHKPPLA